MPPYVMTVDIEPTNRCNAKCHFCPRDATPHEGLMTPPVFQQTLARAMELRETARELFNSEIKVSFCGLGEPLLNPRTPAWIGEVRDAGFQCVMASNASVLDERRGRALLDAGLQQININVGDEGHDYEEIYRLPFERTRDNVLRFAEMAKGRCEINIVIVDHRRDREHVKAMVKYWQDLGLDRFVFFDVMNRSGALFVDDMQYESYSETAEARRLLAAQDGPAHCIVPFVDLFVGYDGNYYLCCSDWKKEAPVGSVFDSSFVALIHEKLERVTSREPICKTCNWDPVNRVTDVLRAINAGEADESQRDELVADLLGTTQKVMGIVHGAEALRPHTPMTSRRPRKLIPLSAE
jgi:MoaA/NifB/PqqE/SkfB family radical SAM enzyme